MQTTQISKTDRDGTTNCIFNTYIRVPVTASNRFEISKTEHANPLDKRATGGDLNISLPLRKS